MSQDRKEYLKLYARQWRKKNPHKEQEYRKRYWRKKLVAEESEKVEEVKES